VARLTALLLLIGVGALASVDLVSGLLDEPRGSAYTDVRDGVQALNTVSLIGGVLVAIAVVVFVINLAVSLTRRSDDDDVDAVDPWEGQTLEWAADPAAITVASGSPLLDSREAGRAG
jgi:heme/copper-type cytochrome/quinol oxidase subunit 1